ncbi:MAG TPA: FAD-dependent oxidoreductase [Edaphobacter sp.]|nr:FAD-dependent oxidoreductase [Edaphobacter sp.]
MDEEFRRGGSFHERLKEHGGVHTTGTHIDSITTEDGKVWKAKIFADCSYEGDLMAEAKVCYVGWPRVHRGVW